METIIQHFQYLLRQISKKKSQQPRLRLLSASQIMVCIFLASGITVFLFIDPNEAIAQQRPLSENERIQILRFKKDYRTIDREIYQLVNNQNQTSSSPFKIMYNKISKLELIGSDIVSTHYDKAVRDQMLSHIRWLKLYKGISKAYVFFYNLQFDKAIMQIENLNQFVDTPLANKIFKLYCAPIIRDLKISKDIPVIDNGDYIALKKIRKSQFIRIAHWSNCSFEKHVGSSAQISCLMTNNRDELTLYVDPRLAINALKLPKPVQLISGCRVEKLTKSGKKYTLSCRGKVLYEKPDSPENQNTRNLMPLANKPIRLPASPKLNNHHVSGKATLYRGDFQDVEGLKQRQSQTQQYRQQRPQYVQDPARQKLVDAYLKNKYEQKQPAAPTSSKDPFRNAVSEEATYSPQAADQKPAQDPQQSYYQSDIKDDRFDRKLGGEIQEY